MVDVNKQICDFTVKYHNKMKKITSPLKEVFNIHSFWYFNVSNEGEFSYLTNNPFLGEYYYSHQLYKNNPFFRKPKIYKPGVFYTRSIQDESYQSNLDLISKNCNVDQSLILIHSNSQEYEGFAFAGDRSCPMYQTYLNHLPLLKKFVRYFLNEASDILSKLNNNKINIAKLLGTDFYKNSDCLKSKINLDKLNLFYQKVLSLSKIPKLTLRENDCLRLTLQGLSAREIADNLMISHRTVEYYLDHIKLKFGCSTKYELFSHIQILRNLDLPNDIFE